jgi:hypothetical protein
VKDWLRFDTVVAICALLVSVITASVLGYQTHVVEEQYAATIWPYLSVDTAHAEHQLRIALTNNGLGPALIGSAQLIIDGKPAPGWTTLADLFRRDPAFSSLRHKEISNTTSSVDESTTIRPGDSLPLFNVAVSNTVPQELLRKHTIALQFCYCSLNDRCWTLSATVGARRSPHPSRVRACTQSAQIEA